MGRIFEKSTFPIFVADPDSITREQGRQVDWGKVGDEFRAGSFPIQTSAAAVAGATTITVDATTKKITSGTSLKFGEGGYAVVTADVPTGATVIPVNPLAFPIADNTPGTVIGAGPKKLQAGTAVGYAGSVDGRKMFPRAAGTNPAEVLLETDCTEGEPQAAKTGYGVMRGGVFYENLLPDGYKNGGTLPAAIKSELRAVGTGFAFLRHENSILAISEPMPSE